MRLWSLNPRYLDRIGLVALWREGLLAKKVLEGKTKGYKKHPQLERFRSCPDQISAIEYYLHQVFLESKERGYKFSAYKISRVESIKKIPIFRGQVDFEFNHLQKKLLVRDMNKYNINKKLTNIDPNPIFYVLEDKINSELWEKGK